ncbi:interleukin-15 receptor subunit alpha [Genypterus blacodes]|uniref:interleukin-15 receptor subunit alpha n=1 Tax=Genypterus blacodes TaxID=154954 RepID=UPI003F776060
MDPTSLLVSVYVIVLLYPIGETLSATAEPCQCPCPLPPLLPLTEPPQATDCCQRFGTFRYKCIDGYTRKAGTSTLIKCRQMNEGPQWSMSTLTCIPDPTRTTTQPPEITPTTFQTTDSDVTSNTLIQQSISTIAVTDVIRPNSKSSGETLILDPDLERNNTQSLQGSGTIGHGLSALGALIVCASLCGIGFVCYKRRSRAVSPPAAGAAAGMKLEEMIPIKPEENAPSLSAPQGQIL